MMAKKRKPKSSSKTGKLRIGDDWNAITIIALSQTNPLKAVAEFVENSIDAKARHITIVRGRERGEAYLKISDDGEGIPRDDKGVPAFGYVATHICDSIKRRLRTEGANGLQGEFGIGLMSFWIVGEALTITSAGADGRNYTMTMVKGEPSYTISTRRSLTAQTGTELKIKPLLHGIRQLTGEKLQWYLASELRDRIRTCGVEIRILDRTARAEYTVEPRQFAGELLHELPPARSPHGEIYLELYIGQPQSDSRIGLYRSGTRVLPALSQLPAFHRAPWTDECLQGIVDAPFLQLTPGTRDAVVQDDLFAGFCTALQPVEEALLHIVEERKQAEEEKASRTILRSIQKALREALLALPAEEYDWFEIAGKPATKRGKAVAKPGSEPDTEGAAQPADKSETKDDGQRQFFEFPGPLHSLRIAPASSVIPVGGRKNFRAVACDRRGRIVEEGLSLRWWILEGTGTLAGSASEITSFQAGTEPSLCRLRATAAQGETNCSAEALITITDSLLPEKKAPPPSRQGLPQYTFEFAPGKLWRSRFDEEKNVVVINNGHRDYVFAARTKVGKVRYFCRLFAKELVLKNFAGSPPEELLDRMIELSLYAEEHLR